MNEQDRLNSWKEIATYLNVAVRTVQRWERSENLPVRRHKHAAASSVFAYKPEIETWWSNRSDLRHAPIEVPAAARPSIAVLPFANLSRNEEDEILADGLTEELINALGRIGGLHVIARTSVFHFKGATQDVRSIAAKLGVRTVLEGSVRRAGDRLRIVAQLINAADGCHLWSERYDRRVEDLLDLQDQIASAIAEALRVRLTAARARPGAAPRDAATYELYLEGRYYLNRRTPAALQHAIRCFEVVLEREPEMALAWAGLADCLSMFPRLAGAPIGSDIVKARAAASRALEADSSRAEGHAALGFITATCDYDWTGAEGHFRRALELNPTHATSHLLYAGTVLAPAGRFEEAEVQVRRAGELDPCSAVMAAALGMHFVTVRDFDQAVAHCHHALDLDPAYPWGHRALGQAFLLLDRFEDAIQAFSKIDAPAFAAGYLGYCYARLGRAADARRLLDTLDGGRPAAAYQAAVLHLALGDRERALACLRQAYEVRSLGVIWLKVDPIWDDVRRDARYTTLLTEMRLANEWRAPVSR